MNEQARKRRLKGLIGLALGTITLALYLPSLRHEFLAYDDQQYVTENPHVQAGVSAHVLRWAWGHHAANWHPLTWLSHALDCQLYGLNPAGHHLTSILLHAANAMLLFLVLSRLTGAMWRSAAVAALFAWHPLHVESVAWIAERKDVLSAFFFLLTLGAYGKYAAQPENQGSKPGVPARAWYGGALILFALGLMAKPMVVTLPFVLLLLDYWPLERIEERGTRNAERGTAPGRFRKTRWPGLLLEKVPFLALTAAACVLTISAQDLAIVSTAGLPLGQRLSHALIAYAHYLGATLVPRHLAVHYPYEIAIPAAQVISAGVLLALVSGFVARFARRRYLTTGWLWFVGMLVPVIGLVQVGDQAWADRYTYLPLTGLFIAVVWGAAELERNAAALRALAVVVMLILMAASEVQLRHWRNTRTLFEHTAQATRNNPLATTMLGSLLAREGKLDEAMELYRTALRWKPGYPEAQFLLGNALDQQGRVEEAVARYRLALWYKPIQEQTHVLLGLTLAKQKRPDEAATHYLAALKLNPESAVAHNNFARLLHAQGRLDDAIAHYTAALQSDPALAPAHNNLGILLLQKGRLAEGTEQLRSALRLSPTNAEAQLNLALALNQQEQWSEAAALFANTVGDATADANAQFQFAVALAHLQRTREARGRYARALLLQPEFPDALEGLSWILATDPHSEFRNGAEAVRMAQRACKLTARDARKLKTLAAAFAEARQFQEAIATIQSALDLAAASPSTDLSNECRLMLESFKSAKPWRALRATP